MTPERWAQVDELFHRIVECDSNNRRALLDEACAGDLELRSEVEELLRYEASAHAKVEAAVHSQINELRFSLVGTVVSHYQIEAGLDGGGMGLVYRAEDLKLGRRVALKFLPEDSAKDPTSSARFEREARAASALEHSNICPIYEFGEHEGKPFIVMQLLEGKTIRELLQDQCAHPTDSDAHGARPALPLYQIFDLGLQIADGLNAAHQKGIIHRDIKPANIFVTSQGQAKILDFGLAKVTRYEADTFDADSTVTSLQAPASDALETKPGLFLSRTGVAMGTAGYMSPEQARGERLDARSDVFSFGLVLYEMATGQRAFEGNTGQSLYAAILGQSPAPVRQLNPKLPHKFEIIINRALEKNRETRYQSVAELRRDLETVQRELSPRNPLRLWMAVSGSIAALALGALFFWATRHSQPNSQGVPELKLHQLTANSIENPAGSGAISSDGRYLAYADLQGIHIKLMDTGETRTVSQPKNLKNSRVDWGVVGWFPDSTRFLVNLYADEMPSSIWTVSVMGDVPTMLRGDAEAWSISHDGSLIAFANNRGTAGPHEIWVMNPNGEKEQKLLSSDANTLIRDARFSPDDKRFVYVESPVTYGTQEPALLSRSVAGGPSIKLLSSQRLHNHLWLPDGRLLYALAEDNERSCNYWTVRIDPQTGITTEAPKRLSNWAGFCLDHTSVTADGKRLVFKEWLDKSSVYTAILQSDHAHITNPALLSLSDGVNEPSAWTADSKAVIFDTDREGRVEIRKQYLDSDTSDLIVRANANQYAVDPRVTPDGKWILYTAGSSEDGPDAEASMARVAINGGPSQTLFRYRPWGHRCTYFPAKSCLFCERTEDRKQLVFTSLDAFEGRGQELARFDTDPASEYDWALSLDGTRIVIRKNAEPRLDIVSLSGHPQQQIIVKGWTTFMGLNWAADGAGIFTSALVPRGSILLYVDLKGNAHSLWEHKGSTGTWAIPAPDGKHLALSGGTISSNFWMMEKF